ncbi:MAG: FAD-binding oxidoreductase [Gammaproteobacteria bacterium]|nr:FAD-binding oxidoreductase [Gammaproteobacteria bacterium]
MDRRLFMQSAVAAGVGMAIPLRALTEVRDAVAAVTGTGAEISIEKAAVKELSDSLRGNLLLPGNVGYDVARSVLNRGIDKHPALIVQPTGVADIQNAVDFAREHELLLAVKCGGHSWSGKSTCDGGMQIDLSTLRNARVDTKARRAYVAGGSLLGELDRESMAHGLVTTAGTVSHTGVGGLTLGGGFGRLARKYGLALDNVVSLDVVTADGQLRHASADENPDLYWALRGGGGNFGIVTSFEFQLHPMDRPVIVGDMVFPMASARDVLAYYGEHAADSTGDLYWDTGIAAQPGADPVVLFYFCHSGTASELEGILEPIRKLKPVSDTFRQGDYVEVQREWDNTDPRNSEYMKAGFVNENPIELIDRIIDGFESHAERSTTIWCQQSGGAIGNVPVDATAFAHRKSVGNWFVNASYDPARDHALHSGYVKAYWKTLEPFTDGWYTNDAADENQQQLHANYQGNFPRLQQVKSQYDPGNLFRLNANIAPSA